MARSIRRADNGRAKLYERIFVAMCICAVLLPAIMLLALLGRLLVGVRTEKSFGPDVVTDSAQVFLGGGTL